MEPIIKHIVTPSDLANHRDLFGEVVFIGEEVELTNEQYAAIGLELHTLTAEDFESNPAYDRVGLVEGDVIERELKDNEEDSLQS